MIERGPVRVIFCPTNNNPPELADQQVDARVADPARVSAVAGQNVGRARRLLNVARRREDGLVGGACVERVAAQQGLGDILVLVRHRASVGRRSNVDASQSQVSGVPH